MPPSALLTNATLALSLIATVLLQVALADRQPTILPGVAELAIAILIAAIIAWRGARSRSPITASMAAAFSLLVALPFISRAVGLWLLGYGNPFEVQLVCVLRNLMLGLAAVRWERSIQAMACLASLFLVLVAFLWTMNAATVVLLVVYAVLGMWWLMGSYWDRLSGHLANKSERAVPARPAAVAIAVVLGVALLATPLARSSRFTTALAGFMPTSGGTLWTDNDAFGGIGDGDQMVKAEEDASSFGPIESELFLESEMPSLYDVFNELGDVPPRKKGHRKRAIPLAPTQMQKNHQHRGKNEQAGREFEAVRRRPNKIPPAADRRSNALLHVTGRVPVHLALEAYDQWDGRTLSSSGGAPVGIKLDNLPDAQGNRWVRPSRVFPDSLFPHRDRRAIKFINLRSSTVPSPPQTEALLLDKANTLSLFGSTASGDLRLDVEFIPQLTTLHVQSRVYRSDAQPEIAKSAAASSSERIANLASEWTQGVAEGWPQVQALCERLRNDYELDPLATAPDDCDEAVEHFLFSAKRGPDYLFATSAAVLLRSLGYETRVRSGFYARESNFNVLARSTAVYKEDAHFWTEVLATEGGCFSPDGDFEKGSWLTIEPTPGYEVLCEPPTLWTNTIAQLRAMVATIASRPLTASFSVILLLAAVWQRALVGDGLVTVWWLAIAWMGDSRHTVRSTIRLLRRRAWLRDRSLKGAVGRWELFPDGQASLSREFSAIASWALYGEGAPAAAPANEVRRVCGQVAMQALRRR